jgi:hypothetical protein
MDESIATTSDGLACPEVGTAMTDAAHPQHSNYQQALRGNSERWDAWCDGLYKQSVGTTATLGPGGPKRLISGSPIVIDSEGITIGGPSTPHTTTPPSPVDAEQTPEERLAQADAERLMQETFGDDYDDVLHHARVGMRQMFPGPDAAQKFRELTQGVAELGPEGTVLVTRFFSDWGRLAASQKGHGS